MMNQPLSPKELVTYAHQILCRDSQLSGSPSVNDLTMGKHVQWLNMPHNCTYNDIIEKAKEIIEQSENRTYIL